MNWFEQLETTLVSIRESLPPGILDKIVIVFDTSLLPYAVAILVCLQAVWQLKEIANKTRHSSQDIWSDYQKGSNWALYFVFVAIAILSEKFAQRHLSIMLVQLYATLFAVGYAVFATSKDVFYGPFGSNIYELRNTVEYKTFSILLSVAVLGSIGLFFFNLQVPLFPILGLCLVPILFLRITQNRLARTHILYFNSTKDEWLLLQIIAIAAQISGFLLIAGRDWIQTEIEGLAYLLILTGLILHRIWCRKNIKSIFFQRW